jgi:outer membrane immunogenic protein
MRNKLISSAAGIAFSFAASGLAFAADMAVRARPAPPPPPQPVFNWTGWYVGVNGGGAWRSKESTFTGFNVDDGILFNSADIKSGNLDPDGGFGGGQIGYNWQIAPQWVVGLEADIQGASIRDSATITIPLVGDTSPDGPVIASATNRLDWFGSVRVRAGYTFVDRWLTYVTGGFAFGGIKDSLSVSEQSESEPLLFGSVNSNKTKTGWIVGWGSEAYITPQLSLRAESDYMSLGTTTLATGTQCDESCNNDIPHATANLEHKYWMFRVGMNYKFSGW